MGVSIALVSQPASPPRQARWGRVLRLRIADGLALASQQKNAALVQQLGAGPRLKEVGGLATTGYDRTGGEGHA